MHSICVEGSRLVVKFELTNDYAQDLVINNWFEISEFEKDGDTYTYPNNDLVEFEKTIQETVEFFIKKFGKENVELCINIQDRLESIEKNNQFFGCTKTIGETIKNKKEHAPNISPRFRRRLMEYQKESVEHMIELGNAANFSVPGSGKTTITYAAISRWEDENIVEKIILIGPTASFLPWEEEYESCFGKKPRRLRINSGDIATKIHELGASYDIFLMHFQTAANYQMELKKFMDRWNTVLIIDESHYIKNPNLGKWASMAISIAPYAKRRVILSGTPMPNNAKDLWTQITFLWPKNCPLGNQTLYNTYAQTHGIGKYQDILNPLFCRIKKNDLQLPEPKWHRTKIPLNKKQQSIYDAIAAKTLKEIDSMNIRDQGQLQKFRMAKMVRLLQTASNPSLLLEKSSEFGIDKETFSEEFGFACEINNLPDIDSTLVEQIKNYSDYEIPSKIAKASILARELVEKGNKVIIWNSFIHNMSIFQNTLLEEFDPIVINGTISRNTSEEVNRDKLITEFKNNPESKVLIASPASLGESVSLHKNSKNESVCNHAIYLDRNFNGAQYMQSMDRIHRIGMNKSIEVNYYLFIAEKTIDEVIDRRLNEKWKNMLNALKDDMLQSLEIEPTPETLNDNEFNEDYKQTIEYLRKHHQENDTYSL